MPVNMTMLAGFVALSAVLSAIPGPSVLLGTSRAITHGRLAGMGVVAGNALGGLVLLAVVLLGLGAIVASSAKVFFLVKIAGAAYLLWLGVHTLWAAHRSGADRFELGTGASEPSRQPTLRQGFVVGIANPKSIVSLMAILPQFVDDTMGHATVQMLVIGLAGGLAQVVIETLWVQGASALRSWFRARPRRVQHLQAGGGLAMIGLAGKLAAER